MKKQLPIRTKIYGVPLNQIKKKRLRYKILNRFFYLNTIFFVTILPLSKVILTNKTCGPD